jgi:hypothetical protein
MLCISIRLNCVAINDVVNLEGNKTLGQYQVEDLRGLGQLIVSLCCRTLTVTPSNIGKLLELIGNKFSLELKNFVFYLLIKASNIDEITMMISHRILEYSESLSKYTSLMHISYLQLHGSSRGGSFS